MPDDVVRCIRCGNESLSTADQKLYSSTEAKPVPGDDTRSPRRINWARVFAAVLTSPFFFLASCTGGMFLSFPLIERIESGVHMDQGRAPDTRMSVIAVIPNADKPGERKVVQVSLGSLERFKQDNPDYSFVPLLGKGEVDDPLAEMRTVYTATTAGPGKVMVETKFHHDIPPAGFDVLARYEATDKEIKPLYTKAGSDGGIALLFGFSLALVLALVGHIFKWRLQRTAERATATARPLLVGLELSGLKSRRAASMCMWSCIAVAVVIVFSGSWFGLLFLFAAWWYWYAITWVDKNDVWK